VDAYATGNYLSDPDVAFRYARGLPVLHPVTRQKIRIDRPLDFLVVADHAEMLRLQVSFDHDDPDVMATETGRRLATLNKDNKRAVFGEVGQINTGGGKDLLRDLYSDRIRGNAWKQQVEMADRNNFPGRFTALIGWEWSAMPNYQNLHRVVFTSADAATASRFLPFSSYESSRPEDLWAWLRMTSRATGAQFIAIPHNSNMSNGLMFERVDSDGRPQTAQYARERAHWEPVMEITQTKGTSETDPSLSPNDESRFEQTATGPPAKVVMHLAAHRAHGRHGAGAVDRCQRSRFGLISAPIRNSTATVQSQLLQLASQMATDQRRRTAISRSGSYRLRSGRV
jgi:hypothetical protein